MATPLYDFLLDQFSNKLSLKVWYEYIPPSQSFFVQLFYKYNNKTKEFQSLHSQKSEAIEHASAQCLEWLKKVNKITNSNTII
jgi:hypothetical protein